MNSAAEPAVRLSADRRTLVIAHRTPAGVLTSTYRSQDNAGFSDTAIALCVNGTPAAARGLRLPGQRNTTRRVVTRFGTLWTHVMLGPPTWWAPRVKVEKGGTVMIGWLRVGVAAKADPEISPWWLAGAAVGTAAVVWWCRR
jgi:hypothetical protein